MSPAPEPDRQNGTTPASRALTRLSPEAGHELKMALAGLAAGSCVAGQYLADGASAAQQHDSPRALGCLFLAAITAVPAYCTAKAAFKVANEGSRVKPENSELENSVPPKATVASKLSVGMSG